MRPPLAPTFPSEPLLLVGASARAAAMSARLWGFVPMAIDLFGDVDLRAVAERVETVPTESWPDRLLATAARFPPAPFLATGGLENHPRILRALERARENRGSAADAVESVRDPFALADTLSRADLPCARPGGTRKADSRLPVLVKPLRGCGGHGIRRADAYTVEAPSGFYLQEFVAGTPASAVFAAGASLELLGVSRQLVGEPLLGAAPFAYCGNVAAVRPDSVFSPRVGDMARRIGSALVKAFGLRGVFGVDFVVDDAMPRVVEVNPRYVASIEVLERAAACRRRDRSIGAVGKAIVFADSALRFDGSSLPHEPRSEIADIPAPGTTIERGDPVLTVFADGADVEACRRRLLARATEIRDALTA